MSEVDQAVVGWRYWQLTAEWRLRSVSQRRFVWQPQQALRAVCVGGDHTPPDPGCGCGIYGARDLESLRTQRLCLDADPLVVGRVALWGRMVTDGVGGYRAEYAAPQTLLVVTETAPGEARTSICEALRAYRVPLGTAALAEVVDDVSATEIAYEAMARGIG